MIPKAMEAFLRERLPERTWKRRLRHDGPLASMEFGPLDIERLARLGITVDTLGPWLVACLWDDESPLEIGGYLVVDNLSMGRPSMGGIRMLPDLTPAAVHNLARGMTLKNAAAQLPFGGGKSGIVAPPRQSPEEHRAVVAGFARLIRRYRPLYLPGPDVGTNDEDMRTVAIENGLDSAVSKPADLGGNRIDELGAAGGGCVIALQALLEEMPRLAAHPSFAGLRVPSPSEVTVLIQGFGAVGAHAARMLGDRIPGACVVGVSDAQGYLYAAGGLPVAELFDMWKKQGLVTLSFGLARLEQSAGPTVKVSTEPNDLLRESAFCLIPAAPIAHYLDVDAATAPSMTVDRAGRWAVIVEGANTYSPDPVRRQARARMERAVYRQRGTLIATDYLVNSGGVIFAAQEKMLRTPDDLRIPENLLGDRPRVEEWLQAHAVALQALAERRRQAGEEYRERVLRRNMRELIDLLAEDADRLPCEAAERISVRRIAAGESERTAADIMGEISSTASATPLQQAAAALVDCGCPLMAVVDEAGQMAGVVTEWDFVRATAAGTPAQTPVEDIMTRQVVTAAPGDSLLEILRRLEHHEFSALPVVADGRAVGIVSSDLLATRSLTRLLQSQTAER
ncbi:MAG TPA: Glu/Leu/Phe/Val dehydrogenase dimerization domain-containing protein [Anaerolineales bacterium]|nr:Glu/Leu/Phe/Val dehydrogenase dimerization domain-containing protein [Anaerolineales bacterium]